MGQLRHIVYFLGAVLASAIIYGCNTSGCLENRSSIPLAGFYSMSTGQEITLDSLLITGIGKGDGTAMNEEGTRISSVYLPFRSTESTTSWQIAYMWKALGGGMLRDTLTFDYESTPYFASNECGVIFKYRITHFDYTTHIIDSIAVTDSLITNLDVERIKIFFRTE